MGRRHLFFILAILSLIGTLTTEKNQCIDTRLMLSECDDTKSYQWLIEIPTKSDSCKYETVAQPKLVPCNLECQRGQGLDSETIECTKCPRGQYSIGSGQEFLYDKLENLHEREDIQLEAVSLLKNQKAHCNATSAWSTKNNVLQGEVQMNCALGLTIKFKLERPGLINITYSLPTSFVFATIKSRCDIGSVNALYEDDMDEEVDSDSKRRLHLSLHATGYGNWSTKTIKISDPGEYSLQLYILGMSSFHFPFSIRSIVIRGTRAISKCNDCPPGSYADNDESSSCKACPPNTFARSGSYSCEACDEDTEYSDETRTKCRKRPSCQKEDYRKVFKRCDKNNMAEFEYIPIEPKICRGQLTLEHESPISCGSCNPGTFRNKTTSRCDFCPPKTYSDGTKDACLPCSSDLSSVTGLYYKYWRDLPEYFEPNFISFNDQKADYQLWDNQSWIPSVNYIYTQPMVDTLSVLSLTIIKGFERTDIAKMNNVYGTLFFNFSVSCEGRCMFSLVYQNIYDDDLSEWSIIHKWKFDETSEHRQMMDYTYSVPRADPIMFGWLFASESDKKTLNEARIYEIRVTNTKVGGSDRCVACLTIENKETECKSCSPGHILDNNVCSRCPEKSIASRSRSTDLVMNKCVTCPRNTDTIDGVRCFVKCQQNFDGELDYDLNQISIIQFQGPKLFTQKGSGYYHLFNATICGQEDVVCARTASEFEKKRTNQLEVQSKMCRMGVVPNMNQSSMSVAYVDDFGQELINISLKTSPFFPALRSDYNLSDITLVYRTNITSIDSACSERVTFLSLRCDHDVEETFGSSNKNYSLQTPAKCVTGTCDGCHFHFLLRTPLACPICDGVNQGYRMFEGVCRFGHQDIRHVPYPYCAHLLTEKIESRRCSTFSLEIQLLMALFSLVAFILIGLVCFCWRRNRKLEYRYMQLVENTNPDDDKSVDNVCAQLSDEDDEEGEQIHFKQSKTKKMMNAVRNVIGRRSNQEGKTNFDRNSFLLTDHSTNEA